MTQKRRNGGKNRKGRGHVKFQRCSNCSRAVPKDKAVKRFLVKNMVDSASQRDMEEASVYDEYVIPKMYLKMVYCISCACHAHIVRVRSVQDRRVREPPRRMRMQTDRKDAVETK